MPRYEASEQASEQDVWFWELKHGDLCASSLWLLFLTVPCDGFKRVVRCLGSHWSYGECGLICLAPILLAAPRLNPSR